MRVIHWSVGAIYFSIVIHVTVKTMNLPTPLLVVHVEGNDVFAVHLAVLINLEPTKLGVGTKVVTAAFAVASRSFGFQKRNPIPLVDYLT